VTVDELHSEDLGGRERGLCRDGKAESLSLRNILGILCDKRSLCQSMAIERLHTI
jgi:hypothetical protein